MSRKQGSEGRVTGVAPGVSPDAAFHAEFDDPGGVLPEALSTYTRHLKSVGWTEDAIATAFPRVVDPRDAGR